MIRKILLPMVLLIVVSVLFAEPPLANASTVNVVDPQRVLLVTYTLTITIDGQGYVTPNATGPYNANDVVQLSVSLVPGWSFLGWSGDLNGSSNPAFVVMDRNKAVTAHFVQTNTLSVTVTTDKAKYRDSDTVNVTGSLSWVPNNIPVTDGLVAVEVRNPAGSLFNLRTQPTGPISGQNWVVNFTRFYPCDQNQVPKYSFAIGQDVWIFAEWKNFDPINAYNVTEVSVFNDPTSAPVGVGFTSGNLGSNMVSSSFFRATSITDSGKLGTFVVYGSLLSGFPKNGGYPYCPEWSFTLTITAAPIVSPAQAAGSVLSLTAAGTYNFSFRFPSGNVHYGNYTVSACSYYGMLATGHTTFYLPLIGDINHDGVVDIYDAILLSKAYNSKPGDQNWNPDADLNGDNAVDIYDAILLSTHWNISR
jgi:hypothetical protein